MDKKSRLTQLRYDRISSVYEWMDKPMDWFVEDGWRRKILSNARGKTLEVGVGTGKNLRFYPENVDITGIDFSSKMLEKALRKKYALDLDADLLLMDVQDMLFEDNLFDFVFTTFVFCSVPDPIKGIQEILRVLKPGGKLMMLEHVRSDRWLMGKIMDALNPITVRMIGANINRETVENVKLSIGRKPLTRNVRGDIVKLITVIKK